MIDRRTDKIGTKQFMEHAIMRYSPAPNNDIAVILDNHSANHSYLVTGFCRDQMLELVFLPPYSSALNPGKSYNSKITSRILYFNIPIFVLYSRTSMGCLEEILGQEAGLHWTRCFCRRHRPSPRRSLWTNWSVYHRGNSLLGRSIQLTLYKRRPNMMLKIC